MKNKNKKPVSKTLICLVSCMIAALFMASVHAKDILTTSLGYKKSTQAVYYRNGFERYQLSNEKTAKRDDSLASKAASHLHNHIDKTMVKDIMSHLNDASGVMNARRETEPGYEAEDTVKKRLVELLLFARIMYASVVR